MTHHTQELHPQLQWENSSNPLWSLPTFCHLQLLCYEQRHQIACFCVTPVLENETVLLLISWDLITMLQIPFLPIFYEAVKVPKGQTLSFQFSPPVIHYISGIFGSAFIKVCLPSLICDFTLILHILSLLSSSKLPQTPCHFSAHLKRFVYQTANDTLIAKYKFLT